MGLGQLQNRKEGRHDLRTAPRILKQPLERQADVVDKPPQDRCDASFHRHGLAPDNAGKRARGRRHALLRAAQYVARRTEQIVYRLAVFPRRCAQRFRLPDENIAADLALFSSDPSLQQVGIQRLFRT